MDGGERRRAARETRGVNGREERDDGAGRGRWTRSHSDSARTLPRLPNLSRLQYAKIDSTLPSFPPSSTPPPPPSRTPQTHRSHGIRASQPPQGPPHRRAHLQDVRPCPTDSIYMFFLCSTPTRSIPSSVRSCSELKRREKQREKDAKKAAAAANAPPTAAKTAAPKDEDLNPNVRRIALRVPIIRDPSAHRLPPSSNTLNCAPAKFKSCARHKTPTPTPTSSMYLFLLPRTSTNTARRA